MTSTVRKTSEARGGFTLIEIVIVLVIAAIIMGGAIGMMTFSSDEYALKKASREIEAMAKRARATSILKQIPYALEFSPGAVRLMPWAEALGAEQMEAQGLQRDPDAPQNPNEPVRWELSLDNGMQSRLRRWDSDQWLVLDEGERQLWRFDPDGLSEPITLELWLDDGRIAMQFNPLTAAIGEVSYQNQ